jgi:hypothetical protein
MARFRFNLRTLFVLATVAIAFLGYGQWRRRHILKQVKEVRGLGGDVQLSNAYLDYLWQRRPTSGHITIGPWADANNVDAELAAEAAKAEPLHTKEP